MSGAPTHDQHRLCLTHALARFRQVPAFGETTIRRFEGDVTEMKQLAGHDLEDLLQVSTSDTSLTERHADLTSTVHHPLL